jgi:hypothetical protein
LKNPYLKWILYGITVVPFWFRLMQCFRRYYETKLTANLKNAGKYFSSICVQVTAIFYGEYIKTGPQDHYLIFFIFLFISLFSTAYSYYWDLYMDWGLFRSTETDKLFLRSKILYPQSFYYFAIVTNLIMRLMWLLPFFKYNYRNDYFDYSQWDITLLCIIEALRRA